MPTDDYGFNCDVCIDPHAIPNRMNPGQMYEAGINRVSVFVQRQALELRHTQGDQAAIDHILGYIRRIHPAYADLIVAPRIKNNPTYFLDTVAAAEARGDVGIFLMIPPFSKHITPEKMIELEDVYQVKSSPVTFYPLDRNGIPYKSRTKCNVSIGSKYMYILYKIPHSKAPGVGYINQFKVPVKPNQHARMKSLIGQTPLRIGEDETRIGTMCSGPMAIMRLMGLYSNSFEAVKATCNVLLRADDPVKVDRIPISNKEIMDTNNIVGVAKHMAATMGINMGNIDCEAFDEAKFTADLYTKHPGDF